MAVSVRTRRSTSPACSSEERPGPVAANGKQPSETVSAPWTIFTFDQSSALPERVRAALRIQDLNSERLIGWAQLVLVSLFSCLYVIAPKPTESAHEMLAPVPYALLGYTTFTLFRLVFAYLDRLSRTVLGFSIFADTALLLGLIWLFHAQYDQPAAFSLKVPTFVYVFVFISLRALRSDPRYVLMAGLASAGGWLVLTLFAISVSEPGTVTRSFVSYLTSNAILIGAEIDKILAILLVTAILAIGMLRAQRVLIASVRAELAGNEIRRFLSAGVAESIANSESVVEPGTATAREAAVVMFDIRGFTRLAASLPAEEVVKLLTSLHQRIIPVIRAHGGVIDKFLGDGIMATFGAVHPSPSAAADALRSLEDVLDEAMAWEVDLPLPDDQESDRPTLNGAMAAGSMVFATLGHGERLEYTVIGEAVNLAAKLEKHNKVLGSRAVTTAAALACAIEQGYRPSVQFELRSSERPAGVQSAIDVVIVR